MRFIPERFFTPSNGRLRVVALVFDGVRYKVGTDPGPLGLEHGPPVTLEQAKALHVQSVLAEYGWNVSQAAIALSVSRQALAQWIALWHLTAPEEPAPAAVAEPAPAPLAGFLKRHVTETLDGLAWNITEAARMLCVHRRTLYRLIEKWQIERPAVTS